MGRHFGVRAIAHFLGGERVETGRSATPRAQRAAFALARLVHWARGKRSVFATNHGRRRLPPSVRSRVWMHRA
eukprot:407250-Lingulodinium_polyedra.AAC.1